jgi:alkanesulfonate monooxygenase
MLNAKVEVFSTCPQFIPECTDFRSRVAEVARWSEEAGCKGILVYSDNSQLDPWLVSEIIIQNTNLLCPLVAVQPAYMHPYSVAKMISSFGLLYGRRFYLNMVAGGFKTDLIALNDSTPHDQRYARLSEYTKVITELLRGSGPANFEGEFYHVNQLRMIPVLPPELSPGIFVSGSSAAGLAAAQQVGATPIEYPKPPRQYNSTCLHRYLGSGIRVGIIAREKADKAWQIAYERFPEDHKGKLTHQLAMKVSDSVWHQTLSMQETEGSGDGIYWLRPFQTYRSFCPYLVGSYEQVTDELAEYMKNGYDTFILDIPASQEELQHINVVFERACKGTSSHCGYSI